MNTAEVFGYSIVATTMEELVDHIRAAFRNGERVFPLAMNPVKVIYARRDPALRRAIESATMLFPDGQGICWSTRLLTGRTVVRIPGVELAERLARLAASESRPLYLLGASEEVNRKAAENLVERYPGLAIAGARHGFFAEDEEPDIVRRIRRSDAEILFVALGSPRQETWIHRHRDDLGVKLAMGVGGTLDILSGRVPRAPATLRRAGLEWAYRAFRQPRKVGRVLDTRPAFVLLTLREYLRKKGPARDAADG